MCNLQLHKDFLCPHIIHLREWLYTFQPKFTDLFKRNKITYTTLNFDSMFTYPYLTGEILKIGACHNHSYYR